MPTYSAICQTITSGGQSFPLYVAFIPAAEIAQIATVPSFDENLNTNGQIAAGCLNPPGNHWQRPLIDYKVTAIRNLYNNSGEFMPNAILLGANCAGNCPSINPPQMIQSPMVSIDIPLPGVGQEPPLWVLDGQHRMRGLCSSSQANDPVPVVLLLNCGNNHYQGATLAKIFAQVTTTATGLDPIHNEWLSYAFRLNHYENIPNNHPRIKSMETVIALCRQGIFQGPPQVTNKFSDQISFIPQKSINVYQHNFSYNCIELTDLIENFYFRKGRAVGVHELSPSDIAREISAAVNALISIIPQPHSSTVFFGTHNKKQTIVQDAFIIGILAYLRGNSLPVGGNNWVNILQGLNLATSNWDFSTWVTNIKNSLEISKRLVRKMFEEIFFNNIFPIALATNWDGLLRGNNANVELTYSIVSATGRVLPSNRQSRTYMAGNNLAEPIAPRSHIKVTKQSLNVAKVDIVDQQSPSHTPTRYSINGFTLQQPQHSQPLKIWVNLTFYGGRTSQITLDIVW